VERAFGVLKNTWQFLDRPILLHDLTDISNRVVSCLLLHNILVTDRVMQETTSVRDVFLQWVLLIRLMQNAPAGERRTVIESTMPLLQCRRL
jgi:hypothetical protein